MRESKRGVQEIKNKMLSLQQRNSLVEQDNEDYQKRLSERMKSNNSTLEFLTKAHEEEVN